MATLIGHELAFSAKITHQTRMSAPHDLEVNPIEPHFIKFWTDVSPPDVLHRKRVIRSDGSTQALLSVFIDTTRHASISTRRLSERAAAEAAAWRFDVQVRTLRVRQVESVEGYTQGCCSRCSEYQTECCRSGYWALQLQWLWPAYLRRRHKSWY